jgi:hypothetical protein
VGQWRITDLQRVWKDGLSKREQLVHIFQAASGHVGQKPFVALYPFVRAVFNQRQIHRPRAWESAAVLSVLLAIWGSAAYVAAAYQTASAATPKRSAATPLTADKRTPIAADTRTPMQKNFDEAFYLALKKGGTADLTAVEIWTAYLEVSDPRRTDLAVLKALALPASEKAARLAELLAKKQEGLYYKTAVIETIYASSVYNKDSRK